MGLNNIKAIMKEAVIPSDKPKPLGFMKKKKFVAMPDEEAQPKMNSLAKRLTGK